MPARKRAKSDTLTGGTGDVKPQQLTASTELATLDTYGTGTIHLPLPRFGFGDDITPVWEILRVSWYLGIADADPNVNYVAYLSTIALRSQGDAASLITMQNDFRDPLTFGGVMDHANGALTQRHGQFPLTRDMTDGAGNGYLIATDQLFVVYGQFSSTLNTLATVKILYRSTGIDIQEYVGIVQSQVS